MRSKFIVLSHYSNEAIGEFDTVGVLPGVYESLEDAKAAADAALAEDLSNGIDHGEVVRVNESTCVLPFDLPLSKGARGQHLRWRRRQEYYLERKIRDSLGNYQFGLSMVSPHRTFNRG